MLKDLLALGLLVCSAASGVWAQQRNGSSLTRAQIREAEQRLAQLGYWTGPVDGAFDVGSRSALIGFQ
jgi:peptidoglycan hydrolase-like protein with peptidoglycan-binding domain